MSNDNIEQEKTILDSFNPKTFKDFNELIGGTRPDDEEDRKAYYFDQLKNNIIDEVEHEKIEDAVNNFIYVNTMLNPEIKNKLINMVDTINDDSKKLTDDIIEYLEENYIKNKELPKENEENIIKQEEIKNENTASEEGVVSFTRKIDKNSENFMAMMLAGLTVSEANYDMYFIKESDSFDYKVTFGNFPANNPNNKLTLEEKEKVTNLANSYDENTNYKMQLSSKNQALVTLMSIIFTASRKQGVIKAGVNNKQGICTIGLSLSKEYQELINSFKSLDRNKYDFSKLQIVDDSNGNTRVRISGDNRIQSDILLDTKLSIEMNKEAANEKVEVKDGIQYVKTLENPVRQEAARVSSSFLIVVAIMEVILIGFYLVMIFN